MIYALFDSFDFTRKPVDTRSARYQLFVEQCQETMDILRSMVIYSFLHCLFLFLNLSLSCMSRAVVDPYRRDLFDLFERIDDEWVPRLRFSFSESTYLFLEPAFFSFLLLLLLLFIPEPGEKKSNTQPSHHRPHVFHIWYPPICFQPQWLSVIWGIHHFFQFSRQQAYAGMLTNINYTAHFRIPKAATCWGRRGDA